ncbi:MAG TPA: alpha/beta hydrolase [Bryobacteraceae bacterium]|nr:alpha/beta hydrolase [Bryobacteraceae bacterium]
MNTVRILLCLILGAAAVWVVRTYSSYRREMAAVRARLAVGSAVLRTGHGAVEYAVEGDGPAVLALHGAGGGYDQGLWAARMAFGDGYKIISASRYGYLRTPLPADASIRSQAAQYRDLLDELRIPRVIVLGVSAGGPSATQFANDYPERTTALVLISAVSQASAAGDKPAFFVGMIQAIQHSDFAYWLVARFFQPAILNLMGMPAGVYRNLTPAQKQLAQAMLDTMHPMSQRYRGTINDGEMILRAGPATAGICAPVLILHAKDDALVSYRHAIHAHEAIPGSRLVLFETGGHGLLPRAEEVRRDVREFSGKRGDRIAYSSAVCNSSAGGR